MVLLTWSRLVPATRDPPATRSDWMRIGGPPFALTRVCGPGWSATWVGAGRQGPGVAAGAPVRGYLQRHLPAAERQEGHVESAGERRISGSGRRLKLRGHRGWSSWMARRNGGQYGVQPRYGQGQRHLQVVVGLGEQVAAHGGDRADVERRERDQRDDHDARHHLEAQLGAQQPPEQRPHAGSSPMTHRNSPGFHLGWPSRRWPRFDRRWPGRRGQPGRDSLRRRDLRGRRVEAGAGSSRRRAGCGSAPARRWPACAADR